MADTPVASAPDVSSSNSSFDWSSLFSLFGIIPSIINFISNRFNNKTQKELQQGAQNWNAEQTYIAWQRGLEQWNRENEYNSPAAQMQRLRDAGINPALAYANGAFNQAATSPDASVSAPAVAARTQSFQMDPLTIANMGVLNAQRDLLQSQSDAISAKLPEEIQNLQQYRKESDQKIDNLNQELTNMKQALANMQADERLTKEKTITESFNRTMVSKEFERKSKETVALVKHLASLVLVNEADADLKKSALALNWQEYAYNTKANAYRLLGLNLDNSLKKMTIGLYYDQHKINQLNSRLLGFDIDNGMIKSAQNRSLYSLYNGSSAFGDVGSFYYKGLSLYTGLMSQMLSPIKGILSVGF